MDGEEGCYGNREMDGETRLLRRPKWTERQFANVTEMRKVAIVTKKWTKITSLLWQPRNGRSNKVAKVIKMDGDDGRLL